MRRIPPAAAAMALLFLPGCNDLVDNGTAYARFLHLSPNQASRGLILNIPTQAGDYQVAFDSTRFGESSTGAAATTASLESGYGEFGAGDWPNVWLATNNGGGWQPLVSAGDFSLAADTLHTFILAGLRDALPGERDATLVLLVDSDPAPTATGLRVVNLLADEVSIRLERVSDGAGLGEFPAWDLSPADVPLADACLAPDSLRVVNVTDSTELLLLPAAEYCPPAGSRTVLLIHGMAAYDETGAVPANFDSAAQYAQSRVQHVLMSTPAAD